MSEPAAVSGSEREPIRRKFAVDIEVGGKRTIDLRIVRFGETATAYDGLGGVPRGEPYEEEWMPGVFERQTAAAHRVLLNFEHVQGLPGIIGKGLALREAQDGYYGSFKVLGNDDGDKALDLVNEGVLTGASMEVFPLKSIRSVRGVIQRVRAHLDAVAICRVPNFPSSVILAVRQQEIVDSSLLPVPFDLGLAERVANLGTIIVPDELTAQPATGTPAESGTPEDGTRQEQHEIEEERVSA